MTTPQQILSLIDENKEKLTDEVYKNLCDKLMELNKVPDQYVRLTGIAIKMDVFNSEDRERRMEEENNYDGYNFYHGEKSIIVQVVERLETNDSPLYGSNLTMSKITKNEYERINSLNSKYGYSCLERGDKKFFVTKMEPLK